MQLTAYCKGELPFVGRRFPGASKMWLSMRLTAILLLATALQVSARSAAQNITLHMRNAPLDKVLAEIKKQSGFYLIYGKGELSKAGRVDVDVVAAPLEQALSQVFKGQPLSYSINGKFIIVAPAPGNIRPVAAAPVEAPPIDIRGKVSDEAGNPLAGVTVMVKGTKIAAATDENGLFTLTGVNSHAFLIFSGVSIITQEYSVSGTATINVRLKRKVGQLDETVVIGYGTTTQRKSTGSVSSITADEIAKQTVTNPLTALQGHIAGMQITQDNGLPGGGVRVQIRGQNSAAAGTIPLYVIDGVPFTLFNGGQPVSDALNAYGLSAANGDISPFSMINPEDIERIDVLKDADATAIYGSRGANGVILITTKKGGKGKTVFNVNMYTGISDVNHYIPMMNTPQYLAMRTEAFANSGVTPTAANASDLTVWSQTAYTDWQKWAIGGRAANSSVTASLSGGTAQNSFLFTSTYHRDGTVFPGSYGANTLSARLNAGHKSMDNRLDVDVSVNYAYMDNNLPTTDLSTIYSLPPNYPIYNSDSTLNWTLTNPLSYLLKTSKAQTTNLLANMNIGYKVLPGLTLKANLGYSVTGLQQTTTDPASAQNIAANATPAVIAAANSMSYANNVNGNYIVEPQAEYVSHIKMGRLQLLAGTTFQQNTSNGIILNGSNYASGALLNSISSAGKVTASTNNYSLYRYDALFGRVNYNWLDKYIFDGTFRRDGSSRFGPDHRFGNFGAAGGAWIFTRERFVKGLDFLSFGKLRASYGITGNDQISNYLYNALYTTGYSGYNYMGSSILSQNSIANPNLHWETTKKMDVALNLGFLKDRILLNADFYRDRSSNQLVGITLPAQAGVSGYTGNFPAVIQNRGWEFELNTTNIERKSIRWTTSVNVTLNQNKLVSFPGLATSSYSSTYIIGRPIDVTQLYHYTGVDEATGLPTFYSKSGSTALLTTDRRPMTVGTPYFGGLTNDISYKGFDLDFTFQFNHRFGYVNNTLASNYSPYGSTYANQSTAILNRWTKTNSGGLYPAAGINSNTAYSNMANSDYNWGDASFVKFKTLSLSYNFHGSWLKRARIGNASLYVQGQNLFTWAKQKYTYDPETTQPGTGSALGTGRYIAFPQLRTMVIGLNLSL
jgi:TonB-linked SusC/RagA family outer membrane protein